MTIRTKAVLFYTERIKQTQEICALYDITDRTLRRWAKAYRENGPEGLVPKKTGPKRSTRSVKTALDQRIVRLKQKHISWGARRIRYQYNLPCHWKTVHNVIKRHGMLIRIKPKPQPCKRFQRRHVDSMWQGDTFEFRISGTGKVYVTGFTDDRSRYRVVSKAYLHKSRKESVNALHHALRKGRVPNAIYLDNGKQFVAKDFKAEAARRGIKLIYGKPHNARGRGKIESYHKTLHRELIARKRFSSLSQFRKELWWFDKKYNEWRKQEVHGWKTPASIYNDPRYFNKTQKNTSKSGHKLVQQ